MRTKGDLGACTTVELWASSSSDPKGEDPKVLRGKTARRRPRVAEKVGEYRLDGSRDLGENPEHDLEDGVVEKW